MTIHFESVLIAAVFATQIFLLAWYLPGRRRRYLQRMFTCYPQSEYPRLYPVSQQRMSRSFALLQGAQGLLGIAAAAVLVLGLFYAGSTVEYARWMVWTLSVQLVPAILSLPWLLRIARAFRALPPPAVRSVELRHWRIVDFVSPFIIGLGLIGSVLAVSCAPIAWSQPERPLNIIALCAGVSLLALTRMVYVLLGPVTFPRPDPFMGEDDTFRARQRRFNMLFGGGAFVGFYGAFMQLYAVHLLRFDLVYLCAGVSVIVQLIALWSAAAQRHDFDQRDFSVYRPNGEAKAAR